MEVEGKGRGRFEGGGMEGKKWKFHEGGGKEGSVKTENVIHSPPPADCMVGDVNMFFSKEEEESCDQSEESADRRKVSSDQGGEQHDPNGRLVAEIDIMIAG